MANIATRVEAIAIRVDAIASSSQDATRWAIAIRVDAIATSSQDATRWRPSLLGWRPSLLGWRPSLLVARTPSGAASIGDLLVAEDFPASQVADIVRVSSLS